MPSCQVPGGTVRANRAFFGSPNGETEVTGEKESTIVYYRTMKNISKHPEQGPKYKE